MAEKTNNNWVAMTDSAIISAIGEYIKHLRLEQNKTQAQTAKEAGIKYPVAVTTNLYHTHINPDPMPKGQDEKGRLWDILNVFKLTAKNAKDSFMAFTVKFSGKNVTIWAVCEASSPTDPSPCISIMLPEDY